MWMRIIKVASGNFLEMYDFMVFAYFAKEIGQNYFPAHDETASLLLTLATFGAGYLMRPLGAVVLGAYMDRHGRRKGLVLTLSLMSFGTVCVAAMPSYQTIGFWAPTCVLLARLLQGFSAGAELGGVSVYLAEIAPPSQRGFYVSWQSASQQLAVIFAALLGLALTMNLSVEQMTNWGWRIPLGVGCLIVPLFFYIRRSLEETPVFANAEAPAQREKLILTLLKNWVTCINGMGLVLMTTVSFYFITAYTPTFGRQALHLSSLQSLAVTVSVGVSNFIWLPIAGFLSDRLGRRPVMLTSLILTILSSYPGLLWLTSSISFAHLMSVELWLSFLYALYNGAMVCYLTEVMPPSIRTAGFSLSYSLATSVGGFTAFFCTWAIVYFSNAAVPGLWLALAAGLSLLATCWRPRSMAALRFQKRAF